MKDFYEFLSHGYNFFGFLVFTLILLVGLREIVYAIRKSSPKTKSKTED